MSHLPESIPQDIVQQARQGKVAAILQVLNHQLAESGIQTRAVLRDGMLHLLCEALTLELLNRSEIVAQVKEILTALSPDYINHSRVYGRVIQPEQLLWLDHLIRDANPQVVWQEDILLGSASLFQRLFKHFKHSHTASSSKILSPTWAERLQEQRLFRRGALAGACLTLGLGGIAIALYSGLNSRLLLSSQSIPQPTALSRPDFNTQSGSTHSTPLEPPASPSFNAPPSPSSNIEVSQNSDEEKFAQAVRLAEGAVDLGKSAQSRAEWLTIADTWETASTLMTEVSPDYSRHATAQNRAALYRRNAEVAQEEADKQ
ncbi:MAG: hypothetical protein ACRC8A_03620 [Microcoleaceae cyanobacterium]